MGIQKKSIVNLLIEAAGRVLNYVHFFA